MRETSADSCADGIEGDVNSGVNGIEVTDNYRERCASAHLRRAVERAMVALYSRCSLIPSTSAGYEMIRNEVACMLGDLRCDAVKVEPQPPGFRVTWNGVDCTWLGTKTTATGPERIDAVQRIFRTASAAIVDRPPNPECTWSPAAEVWSASNEHVALYNPPVRTACRFCEQPAPRSSLSEYTVHAWDPAFGETFERFYACHGAACAETAWKRCEDGNQAYKERQDRTAFRPDGFAQSAVDAAKAVLLAPATKRGGR